MGAILPPENEIAALEADQSWRLIYLLQPLLYILVLVLFIVLIGIDPPKFYLLTG